MKIIKYMMAFFVLASAFSQAAIKEMDDESLSFETGQGSLFVVDKVLPNSLAGAGGAGSNTDFTYYRMGLDVQLGMNMNIDRLRLGCGGSNDAIDAGVCDIDMEYVRFMGRCTTGGCGQTSTDGFKIAGSGNAVSSDFTLTRPYVEIAVRNDANPAQREVAGFKIGAQTADGFVGVGYGTGTSHVGINSISGYLNATISVYLSFTSGLGGGSTCIGAPTGRAPCNGLTNYNAPAARTTGTRQRRLQTPSLPLENLHGAGGLLSLFSGSDIRANLDVDLKFLHGFQLINTSDFFLSLQRESIRYPNYAKTGYAVAANTGWWMNVPKADLLDITPPSVDLGCPGFLCTGLLSAFGDPGLRVSNVDIGSRAPDNCHGTTAFC